MPFKQKKHYNKTPQRRRISGVGAEEKRTRRTPVTFECEISTTTLNVTFNVPVVWNGELPGWAVDSGVQTVTIVQRVTATTYILTWSATIAGANFIVVPFEDPAFRSMAGGYVNAGSVAPLTP